MPVLNRYKPYGTTAEHVYVPDYLVRLTDGRILILEVKGFESEQDRAKHDAALQWVRAVNNTRKIGNWTFLVCKNPNELAGELRKLVAV